MGYDASCTLRFNGTSSKGKASLEHKDLVFRGPTRLVIPLADIARAHADGGVLRVRFGHQSAEFEIGDSAPKWAARITHPPSRLDKLGVKPGMRVAAAGLADASFVRELKARGAVVVAPAAPGTDTVDLLFYPAEDRNALEGLRGMKARIQPDGAIWIVRPKGSRALTESETMAAGRQAGLVDVKVVSFSETHTAEKFVIPLAKRSRGQVPRPAVRSGAGGRASVAPKKKLKS